MRACKTLTLHLILTVFFFCCSFFQNLVGSNGLKWLNAFNQLPVCCPTQQPSYSSALLSKSLIKVFALLPLQKLEHKDSFYRLIEPVANDSEAARHHFLLTSPVTLACCLRGPSRPAGGHSSPPTYPHVSSPSSSEMTIDQKAGININSH